MRVLIMNLFNLLCALALICAFGSIIIGGQMVIFLREKNVKANPWMLRWMIFKYAADYKRITLKETGKVGPLYKALSVSTALLWLFAVSAILVKVL